MKDKAMDDGQGPQAMDQGERGPQAKAPKLILAPLPEPSKGPRLRLMPGFFQVMQGGSRSGRSFLYAQGLPDGGMVILSGPDQLRPTDARLLCVLASLARSNPPADYDPIMVRRAPIAWGILGDSALRSPASVRTSFQALAKGMGLGWHGGGTSREIMDSLDRMRGVIIALETAREGAPSVRMSRLVSRCGIADGIMALRVSPIVARALIGGGRDAPIDMGIAGKLRGNDFLIFIALSLAIAPGGKRSFARDDIRAMLYGPLEKGIAQNTLAQQRSRSLAALKGLVGKLPGWKIVEEGGRFSVFRPRGDGRPGRKASDAGDKDTKIKGE